MTPEGAVLKEVIAFLKKVPGVYVTRNLSGRVKTHGRIYAYGCFVPGGADLIGWYRRSIPMTKNEAGEVNCRIAQFLAIEVKVPGGRISPEQEAFLADARTSGCIAGVVHSVEEAAALLGVELR